MRKFDGEKQQKKEQKLLFDADQEGYPQLGNFDAISDGSQDYGPGHRGGRGGRGRGRGGAVQAAEEQGRGKVLCKFDLTCHRADCIFQHTTADKKSPAAQNGAGQFDAASAHSKQHSQKSENLQSKSQLSNIQKTQCKYNLNCKRTNCFHFHDTPNGKSPASQIPQIVPGMVNPIPPQSQQPQYNAPVSQPGYTPYPTGYALINPNPPIKSHQPPYQPHHQATYNPHGTPMPIHPMQHPMVNLPGMPTIPQQLPMHHLRETCHFQQDYDVRSKLEHLRSTNSQFISSIKYENADIIVEIVKHQGWEQLRDYIDQEVVVKCESVPVPFGLSFEKVKEIVQQFKQQNAAIFNGDKTLDITVIPQSPSNLITANVNGLNKKYPLIQQQAMRLAEFFQAFRSKVEIEQAPFRFQQALGLKRTLDALALQKRETIKSIEYNGDEIIISYKESDCLEEVKQQLKNELPYDQKYFITQSDESQGSSIKDMLTEFERKNKDFFKECNISLVLQEINDQMKVSIVGPLKKSKDIIHAKNLLKTFHSSQITTRQILFSPNQGKDIRGCDEDDEEKKGGAGDMDAQSQSSDQSCYSGRRVVRSLKDSYYIYQYLNSKNLNLIQLLLDDQEIKRESAQIAFNNNKFEISLTATLSIFAKVYKMLMEIINEIKIVELKVNSPMILGIHRLPKTNSFLREKYEQKYSVLIYDDIIIEKRRKYDGDKSSQGGGDRGRGRGRGRGGAQESNHLESDYYIKSKCPERPQRDQPSVPIPYTLVIIGGTYQDAVYASDKIKEDIGKYVVHQEAIPFKFIANEQLDAFKEGKAQIQKQTNVYIRYQKQGTTFQGKQASIQDAKQQFLELLQDLTNPPQAAEDFISLKSNPLAICVNLIRHELEAEANKFGVTARVEGLRVNFKGPAKTMQVAKVGLQRFVDAIEAGMMIHHIEQRNFCEILKAMQQEEAFKKTYRIAVTRLDNQLSEEFKEEEEAPVFHKQTSRIVLSPQWSYKVYATNPMTGQKDHNYNQRHDKVNDFFYFDPDQNWQIERHYQDCCSGLKLFNSKHQIIGDQNGAQNRFIYEVWGPSNDPRKWFEQNVTLRGVARPLNRVMVNKEEKVIVEEKAKSSELSAKYGVQGGQMMLIGGAGVASVNPVQKENSGYLIQGFREEVQKLIQEITDRATDPQRQFSFLDVPHTVNYTDSLHQVILQLLREKFSRPGEIADIKKIENGPTQDVKLKIIGFKHKDIKTQVKSILDKAVSFPPEWERVEQLITCQQQFIIAKLPFGSPEFTKVQLKFNLTMPSSQIQRIERIQNRKLWKVFQNELDDVTLKNNNQNAQLLDLFHGTSGTPPNSIYESEEGFNIVYSNDGMWGRANYFAVNSEYSNAYAFRVPGLQTRQMFMASVIVGKYAKLNPDRTLKEPPVNASTGKRYDSVQGNTGGSDVYMVYSNKKAYPSYLITYK
ncbi:hypothetical protein FGO68_gene9886 [Halteria grandinella]|uniref:Poly [ADP-ribose] polymerase n=1 Tax=Halteria grandinella TaxID=5974 RepID=A0A8J8P3K9_HALGN|nr:hypothetical protein FGO68_gene9886 [Halteria grandinella]